MNTIIASLALVSSIASMPSEETSVLPSQAVTLSKAEIVEIIDTEHKTNQLLEDFNITLPRLTVSSQRIALLPSNNNVAVGNPESTSGE